MECVLAKPLLIWFDLCMQFVVQVVVHVCVGSVPVQVIHSEYV